MIGYLIILERVVPTSFLSNMASKMGSIFWGQDQIVWKFNSSGEFSVMSAYDFLKRNISSFEVDNAENHTPWLKLWKLNIPY